MALTQLRTSARGDAEITYLQGDASVCQVIDTLVCIEDDEYDLLLDIATCKDQLSL